MFDYIRSIDHCHPLNLTCTVQLVHILQPSNKTRGGTMHYAFDPGAIGYIEAWHMHIVE
jgi:hypothetical protein